MIFKPLPFLFSSVIFVIFIRICLKKSNNGYYESLNDFINRELNANSTIKDINSLNLKFISSNEGMLPFNDYPSEDKFKSLIKKQNIVKKKLPLKMIKIPPNLSNTELKEIYGVNNFEEISIYEEHFNGYIRALYDWANELFNLGYLKECEKVLLEGVRLEGDISQIYCLLGDIYLKNNNKNKLNILISTVEGYDLSLKEKILNDLNKKVNSI